jgi:cell division protease FtsH
LKRSFNPWLLVLLIVLGVFVFSRFNMSGSVREVPYSTFTQWVDEGAVQSAIISRNDGRIEGVLKEPEQVQAANGETQAIKNFTTLVVVTDSLLTRLEQNVGDVKFRNPPQWIGFAISVLPIIILIGFFWFVFMRAQGGPNQVMQFGQSKARTYGRENKVKTLFGDVAGHKEAKQELLEIVDFLKNPQKYHRIGAEIPKGVLLVGPPGTGKTLLARAVAGEAGVPFMTVSASEFMEMFVGVGASRVRSLFDEARKSSPSIIFIDEIDSIGRRRGAGIGGGHDEREQTLNQILSEMDGFEKDTSVIVVAATNRPDVLDPALLRPGRFDRQVTIGLPTQSERKDILAVHVRNKPIADDVALERMAEATPMFSGADLENLTNEAALIAARTGKQIISLVDFNEALDRIILGLRRGSLVPSENERRILAYHEAGHAVAAVSQPLHSRLRKVTIMPRGDAGGYAAYLSKEQMVTNVNELRQRLISIYGGRIAEKKMTGTISTGAASDLKQATDLAKRMVFDLGMGKEEFVAWGSDSGPVFLGGEISRRKDFSENTARELEEEVLKILGESYKATEVVVDENWTVLQGVAEALLQVETLDGELIHQAFEKAKEGLSAADITAWILSQSKDTEIPATPEAPKLAEEVRKRPEAPQAPKNLDPRPADS